MNKIWLYMVLLSSLVLIYFKPEMLLVSMLSSAQNVVVLCIEFCAIYSVWMGLLEILEASGISKKLAKFLSPLVKKLFKTQNEEAIKQISVSLSACFLGLGNASTPSAIKAMQALDEKNGKLNYPMFVFLVISCCSIQVLPTTIISMRTQAGSTSAYDIILPTIITSIITTFSIVALAVLYQKLKNVRVKK